MLNNMSYLFRYIIILIITLNSCSGSKQSIDKSHSDQDYIFIDGKKVLITRRVKDSIEYKTDSSYLKNKLIERKYIEKGNR